jgi:hypothetical protein
LTPCGRFISMRKDSTERIGISLARSGFVLGVSSVRGGISVAIWWLPGRDPFTHAPHRLGAGDLLHRRHCIELEIYLRHPHRFLNDYHDLFACCRMACCEEADLRRPHLTRPQQRWLSAPEADIQTRAFRKLVILSAVLPACGRHARGISFFSPPKLHTENCFSIRPAIFPIFICSYWISQASKVRGGESVFNPGGTSTAPVKFVRRQSPLRQFRELSAYNPLAR